MPQYPAHTMNSPLPSSARAGGPPGTRPWGIAPVQRHPSQPPTYRSPKQNHCSTARQRSTHPTPFVLRSVQRKSYAIASLQQKLDAQRAANFSLQTNYDKLQSILTALIDVWHETKRIPLPSLAWEDSLLKPGCNDIQPPYGPPNRDATIQTNQSSSCSTSADLLPEQDASTRNNQSSSCSTPTDLLPEQDASTRNNPLPQLPTPELLPPTAVPSATATAAPATPAAPVTRTAPPAAQQPDVNTASNTIANNATPSTGNQDTTPLVGSVPVDTPPATTQPIPCSFSEVRQKYTEKMQWDQAFAFKPGWGQTTDCRGTSAARHPQASAKVGHQSKRKVYGTKRSQKQRNTQDPEMLSTWLETVEDSVLKPLRHGSIWKPSEETPVYHSCAPPPGWTVVNGITVLPTVEPQCKSFLGSGDQNLALWFCTKCYLDTVEKPPNFEMCRSCGDNYYFPKSIPTPWNWACQGCKELGGGANHAFRQCHHCHKVEEISPPSLVDFMYDP